MVEIFGMQVNLKLHVENLKDITKQVKDSVRNIPTKVTTEITQITKGIQAGVKPSALKIPSQVTEIAKATPTMRKAEAKGVGGLVKGIQTGVFGEKMTGGGGSGLGQILGKAGLVIGVLGVIADGVKKIVAQLARASPMLAGVLRYFEHAFMIFLRPFGDFLATLLKPLAIWLMKMAIEFLKWTRTPGGKTAVAGVTGVVGGAMAGAAIGSVVPGVGTLVGAGVGAAVGGLLGVLSQVDWNAVGQAISNFVNWILDSLGWVVAHPVEAIQQLGMAIIEGVTKFGEFLGKGWDKFIEWLGNALPKIGELIGQAWRGFIDWLSSALPNFAGWLGEQLGRGLRAIVDFIINFGPWMWNALVTTFKTAVQILNGIGTWIWNTLTSLLKTALNVLIGIGNWLWNTITNFLRDPLGTMRNLGSWIWNTVTGAMNNIWSWMSGFGKWLWNTVTDSIKNFFGGFWKGFTGHQVGLNFVPSTGLYLLHRGEKVVSQPRAEGTTGRTVIYRPTFVLSGATVQKDIDVDSFIRRASRVSEQTMRKRGLI